MLNSLKAVNKIDGLLTRFPLPPRNSIANTFIVKIDVTDGVRVDRITRADICLIF